MTGELTITTENKLAGGLCLSFLIEGPQYMLVLYLRVYHFVNTIGYVLGFHTSHLHTQL